MNIWEELIGNVILISSVTGWVTAQVLKTLINFRFTKKFNPERLIGSGGMPSSHAATVCALTTATGFQYSVSSFEFAVTAILSIIVMYDAMGVRRETGEQSKLLNQIIVSFKNHDGSPFSERKLKEYIGHTPLQVLAGMILGILIAVLIHNAV